MSWELQSIDVGTSHGYGRSPAGLCLLAFLTSRCCNSWVVLINDLLLGDLLIAFDRYSASELVWLKVDIYSGWDSPGWFVSIAITAWGVGGETLICQLTRARVDRNV